MADFHISYNTTCTHITPLPIRHVLMMELTSLINTWRELGYLYCSFNTKAFKL